MHGRVSALAIGWRALVLALAVLVSAAPPAASALQQPARVLRVCADPNNLPFSNRAHAGFEDAIADVVAADLDATLEYTFWAQRRGFVRNTLAAGRCDVMIGVPSTLEQVRTTRPYYRARYAFVSRKDRALGLSTLADPGLARLRLGIHVVGDEVAGTPLAYALARHDLVDNVVGFNLYGDYAQENPPAAIFEAVAKGDIDVALVWGPLAAFVHRRSAAAPALAVAAVRESHAGAIPLEFAISMGVRKSDVRLQRELDRLLMRQRAAIEGVLERHGVPYLPVDGSAR